MAHNRAVADTIARLLDVTILDSCISVLGIEHNPTLRTGKKAHMVLVRQIHPDKLGVNVDKAQAREASLILIQAYGQCRSEAELSAYRATGDLNAPANPDYVVAETLLFSFEDSEAVMNLRKAQQRAFEAEEDRVANERREANLEREEKKAAEAEVADAEFAEAEAAAAAAAASAAATASAAAASAAEAAARRTGFGDMEEDFEDEDIGDDEDDGFNREWQEAPAQDWHTNFAALFIPAAPEAEAEEMDRSYPEFEGEEDTEAHFTYPLARKDEMRRRGRCFSNKIAKTKAKNRVLSEGFDSITWAPLPVDDIAEPEVGMAFDFRWQSARYVRGVAAKCADQGLARRVPRR